MGPSCSTPIFRLLINIFNVQVMVQLSVAVLLQCLSSSVLMVQIIITKNNYFEEII